MANHGYITSRKHFDAEQIENDLREINERRFKSLLTIEPDSEWKDGKSWFISYKDKTWEWPEGFSIRIVSPQKMMHQHECGWALYLGIVFSNELGAKHNATMSDECDDGEWEPHPSKYPTYKDWVEYSWKWCKDRHPLQFKKCVDEQMEYVPEELRDC